MSSFSQVFGYFPYKIKTSKKIIAITFDDGPNDPYTSELLDFFKREKYQVYVFFGRTDDSKIP
jgi:Predicted xylanase/chitin deacetylase